MKRQLALALALVALVLVTTGPASRQASADSPHYLLNYFLSAGSQCDTDSGSSVGSTCTFPLGSQFTVAFNFSPLPGDIPTFGAQGVLMNYTGLTTSAGKASAFMSTSGPRQGCDVAVPSYLVNQVYLQCLNNTGAPDIAQSDLNASDLGPGTLVTQVFNCAASGTISLSHGTGNTATYDEFSVIHTEAASGNNGDLLTIQCRGEMGMYAFGGSVSCNAAGLAMTSCTSPLGSPFTVAVNAVEGPAGGYSAFQTEVAASPPFGSILTWTPGANCSVDVVWPDEGALCLRTTGPAGQAQHFATTSSVTPPFVASTFLGDIVYLTLTCAQPGVAQVGLPAWPSSLLGALYHDGSGDEIAVRANGQGSFDLNGDGTAEAVSLADSLQITCYQLGEIGTGQDPPVFNGDGTAGTTNLNLPSGMYETGTGNSLYFADMGWNLVRKVIPNATASFADDGVATLAGILPTLPQTVCGGATNTFGDNCPATQALLSSPRDVFVHTNGNLYIADRDHCLIRMVTRSPDPPTGDGNIDGDTDETITTVAGRLSGATHTSPLCDISGTVDGDGGPAVGAYLDHPAGVAVDAQGNIYIADTNHEKIRKVDAITHNITTVAGTGSTGSDGDNGPALSARLNKPHDVYFLRPQEDDLLIADTASNKIRALHVASGTIVTIGGTGAQGFSGDFGGALNAQLWGPEAVTADQGLIFIADTKNNRMRRIDPLTGIIVTFMSADPNDRPIELLTQPLNQPAGIAVGEGTVGTVVSVANTLEHQILPATINPDTGTPQQQFQPTQSCGALPGIASIDWVLPVGMLGILLVRKRFKVLFIRLLTMLSPRSPRRTAGSTG